MSTPTALKRWFKAGRQDPGTAAQIEHDTAGRYEPSSDDLVDVALSEAVLISPAGVREMDAVIAGRHEPLRIHGGRLCQEPTSAG
jgi:hypothetical protein